MASQLGQIDTCTVKGIQDATDALTVGADQFKLTVPVYNNRSKDEGCFTDADCKSGLYCNLDQPTQAWSCDAATGVDSFKQQGTCKQTPCDICQACLDTMNSKIKVELKKNATDRSHTVACEQKVACNTDFKNKYIAPEKGYFGLRAGALCAALGECKELPTTCILKAAVNTANITGKIDLCTAEGVAGGSVLSSKC